ncbi:hypothetical protein Avbf_16837, partial [Armadillidium vulgare]
MDVKKHPVFISILKLNIENNITKLTYSNGFLWIWCQLKTVQVLMTSLGGIVTGIHSPFSNFEPFSFTFNAKFTWVPRHYQSKCRPNCLKVGTIKGTTIYSPDSSICSAAVHAGVIDPNENETREVSFSKMNSNTSFVGSVRNRRVSDSFSHRLVGNTAIKIFQWLTNKVNDSNGASFLYRYHDNASQDFSVLSRIFT